MSAKIKACRDCDKPALIIDTDYDEGYCVPHFEAQQASSEPVENWVEVES